LHRPNDGTYKTAQADPTCILGTSDPKLTATVRAGGLVLLGSVTGYAGRPEAVTDAAAAAPYELRSGSADPASCPILTERPSDWPPSAAAMDACDADPAACRAACEKVLLQRKARRFYYPTDVYQSDLPAGCFKPSDKLKDPSGQAAYLRCTRLGTPATSTAPGTVPGPWTFPLPAAAPSDGKHKTMPVGPVLSFKVGYRQAVGEETATPPTLPPRGSTLTLISTSGVQPHSRHPYSGTSFISAVLPGGMVVHDRSVAANNPQSGQRIFAAFQDNVVLDFATDELNVNGVQIR